MEFLMMGWFSKVLFKIEVRFHMIRYADSIIALQEAAKEGDLDMVKFLFQYQVYDKYHINTGMSFAARFNHLNIVEFFISKGADDLNLGLCRAASNKDAQLIIDFFVSKGANDWNSGMVSAAYNGNRSIIDFFISKGANKWNSGLNGAAFGGYQDLVEFFVAKGANNFDNGLKYAVSGGYNHYLRNGIVPPVHGFDKNHQSIIDFLLEQKELFAFAFTNYTGSDICTICYDPDPQNLIILNCNHVFHQECYKVLHISCPLCQIGIKTNK